MVSFEVTCDGGPQSAGTYKSPITAKLRASSLRCRPVLLMLTRVQMVAHVGKRTGGGTAIAYSQSR